MQLSVIIVNYNVKYFLEQCLHSVLKALKNIEGEIIVIDNHSTDDSFSFFQNCFPQVHFVWNTVNVGFARANNQALQMAKGEYILFLNPDTIVPEDCFEKCTGFLKKNKGALGIRMLDGTGNFLKESKRAFPSPMTSLYKLFGLAKLFPRSKTFAKYHLSYLSEGDSHEVDVLAGAFMMISKEILDEVGGFDEEFFMYGEDIDLSYRIQKAGFKNYYFAESSILHFKGESTKKGSLNYVKIFYKAMSIFVKKHYGSQQAGLYSFFIHIAIFIRASMAAVSRLVKRKWKEDQKKEEATEEKSILIAGSEAEFIKVKEVLNATGRKGYQYERINTRHEDTADSFGPFDEIKKIGRSFPEKKIILCEGTLSFKEIIGAIQEMRGHTALLIFSEGSRGVIGSDEKF
ncbi:MAG: glycosyltransferase family 2 protein [Ginsengibacter sp.]